MKKVVEFLAQNPVQYLATVGRDGKAKCRPLLDQEHLHEQHEENRLDRRNCRKCCDGDRGCRQ